MQRRQVRAGLDSARHFIVNEHGRSKPFPTVHHPMPDPVDLICTRQGTGVMQLAKCDFRRLAMIRRACPGLADFLDRPFRSQSFAVLRRIKKLVLQRRTATIHNQDFHHAQSVYQGSKGAPSCRGLST